jgi:hypothetical protein
LPIADLFSIELSLKTKSAIGNTIMSFASIEEAANELKEGRMIIVVP